MYCEQREHHEHMKRGLFQVKEINEKPREGLATTEPLTWSETLKQNKKPVSKIVS